MQFRFTGITAISFLFCHLDISGRLHSFLISFIFDFLLSGVSLRHWELWYMQEWRSRVTGMGKVELDGCMV